MQVVTDILREDVWKATRYYILHYPSMRQKNMRRIYRDFMTFSMVLMGCLGFNLFPPIVAIIGAVILGALYLAINFLVLLPIQIRKMPIPEKGVLGKHIIQISEEGLREATDVNESFRKWEAVTNVLQNAEYIFIFDSDIMVHIIPKRAFKEKSEAEHFYSMAYGCWQAARAKNIVN